MYIIYIYIYIYIYMIYNTMCVYIGVEELAENCCFVTAEDDCDTRAQVLLYSLYLLYWYNIYTYTL